MFHIHLFRCFPVIFITTIVMGCDQHPQLSPMGQNMTQEVGIKVIHVQPVMLDSELTGRVNSSMTSDVRPQVDGIIKQRLFTEGSEVKAGQVLYLIDPATYQASYDEALAQLKNAQATVVASRLKAERYASSVKDKGVSKQDADDAQATYQENAASVAQYKAALESASINLEYTKVRAPISGQIGISSVTPGALVTANQTDALATIRQLDPIYVDITQSSTELLKFRQQRKELQVNGGVPVTLRLEDGSAYPVAGKLELTEVSVNETTGSVTLRAIFQNPDHTLFPGMYVRAVVRNGVNQRAVLAPQQGISRNVKGDASALVVDDNNKVEQRTVIAQQVIGTNWLISRGLEDGDRLIVEGTSKVKVGDSVKAEDIDGQNSRPIQGTGQEVKK